MPNKIVTFSGFARSLEKPGNLDNYYCISQKTGSRFHSQVQQHSRGKRERGRTRTLSLSGPRRAGQSRGITGSAGTGYIDTGINY